MGSWKEYRKQTKEDVDGADLSDHADWIATHPILGEGMVTPKTATSTQGSLSVTLFFEDGRFKCAVSSKIDSQVAFMTLEGMEDPMGEIEAAMAKNELDWRKSNRR